MKTIIIILVLATTLGCAQEPKKAKALTRLEHMKSNNRQVNLQYKLDKLEETSFRFPCGDEAGTGYYVSQKFQDPNMNAGDHLGIDVSGNGGGNTDLGDTIYSTSNGIVAFAEDYDLGYISIYHKHNNNIVKSIYYHCDTVFNRTGDIVQKGQAIATIGKRGTYQAHLHFEIASDTTISLGGYGDPTGFIDPVKLFTNFKQK